LFFVSLTVELIIRPHCPPIYYAHSPSVPLSLSHTQARRTMEDPDLAAFLAEVEEAKPLEEEKQAPAAAASATTAAATSSSSPTGGAGKRPRGG
jgi:hypothetical protein